jgi:protein-S-isoprenylcysteine O-methyltransferase Ste14
MRETACSSHAVSVAPEIARPEWSSSSALSLPRLQRLFGAHLTDTLARVLVGGLFLALAVRIGEDFLETRRVTGLLLLLSELLVVVLMVCRTRATIVDRTWTSRLITAVALVAPPLYRPATVGGLVADWQSAALLTCGLLVGIAGKLSLGRSFGLVPANRGIKRSGMYRLVRHPIYSGYIGTHFAFVLAHPTYWNLAILVLSASMLVVRSVLEERTLASDPEYVSYRNEVRWRLCPGVF